jgi:hypothetical protein
MAGSATTTVRCVEPELDGATYSPTVSHWQRQETDAQPRLASARDAQFLHGLAFHPAIYIHKLAWFLHCGLSAYVSIERIGPLDSCFAFRSWWQLDSGASAMS